MLVVQTSADTKKVAGFGAPPQGRLVGYILTTRRFDPGPEAIEKLRDRAEKSGCRLSRTEFDVGCSRNPYRVGLWRALRKLVCDRCEPRRLAYSLANFEDFILQALKPCICGNKIGLDGLVVKNLDHITNDPKKGARLCLELARRGKHLYADDGICLTCCHPATKQLLTRQ